MRDSYIYLLNYKSRWNKGFKIIENKKLSIVYKKLFLKLIFKIKKISYKINKLMGYLIIYLKFWMTNNIMIILNIKIFD